MDYAELLAEHDKYKSLLHEATDVLEEVLVSGNFESGPYAPAGYSLALADEFKSRCQDILEE